MKLDLKEGQAKFTRLDVLGSRGYILAKPTKGIIKTLSEKVQEIENGFDKAIPYNDKLAGQIDKEYQIDPWNDLELYLLNLSKAYNEGAPNYMKKNDLFSPIHHPNIKVSLSSLWVNFQEKYEYNPPHNHSGLYSFVIWHKIPFTREDEIKFGPGKGKTQYNTNGNFCFLLGDGDHVASQNLPVDKSWENILAFFPSDLYHQVYPFYSSDEYRVTVSGNLYISSI